tara:strand:- start:270 stop:620 length:351 start_codon:yes stop_codon:yes gene_type:complete
MRLTKEDKMILRRIDQNEKDLSAALKKYKDTGTSSHKKKFEEYDSINKKESEDIANIRAQGKNAPKGKTFGAKHTAGSVNKDGTVKVNRLNTRTKHKDWRKTGMFNVSRPSQKSKK